MPGCAGWGAWVLVAIMERQGRTVRNRLDQTGSAGIEDRGHPSLDPPSAQMAGPMNSLGREQDGR